MNLFGINLMEPGEADSELVLAADAMIMAVATSQNLLLRKTTKGLETNKRG